MAPNDYAAGTGNESGKRPFTNENGQSNPQILTAVEARQGVISGRVVKVLGVSISLALLAMVLCYLVAF